MFEASEEEHTAFLHTLSVGYWGPLALKIGLQLGFAADSIGGAMRQLNDGNAQGQAEAASSQLLWDSTCAAWAQLGLLERGCAGQGTAVEWQLTARGASPTQRRQRSCSAAAASPQPASPGEPVPLSILLWPTTAGPYGASMPFAMSTAGRLLGPGNAARDRADFWLGSCSESGGILLKWLAVAVPELLSATPPPAAGNASGADTRDFSPEEDEARGVGVGGGPTQPEKRLRLPPDSGCTAAAGIFSLPLVRRTLATYAAEDWAGLSCVILAAARSATAVCDDQGGGDTAALPPLRWMDLGGGSGDALLGASSDHGSSGGRHRRVQCILFEIPEVRVTD